jgi:ribonucleoside-diphosphate reductase alpha chain
MQHINVIKRDGRREPLNIEKIHQQIEAACKDVSDVSISQVEMKSHIQFYDGITSQDIQKIMIKSAADLISQETPNYQYVAARLVVFDFRKSAYGHFETPHIYDHVKNLVAKGKYDPALLSDYSKEEYDEMESFIDHTRDYNFSYAATKQWEGKYLVKDRVSQVIYETPQMAYMLIAASLFSMEAKDVRMKAVKMLYDACSLFKVSLPTPIMSGVRTPTRQFSSCVLIEAADSLDSINATAASIVKYISQRAGIGVNIGSLRGIGAKIRGGEAFHTGVTPFIKHFQTAVKSCSQGGVRGGAATLFYPVWHWEFENMIVLKNNRGTEENRVRHLDYGVQLSKLFYQRLLESKEITLFSPDETPDLLDAFYKDQVLFEKLYVEYERNDSVRKKKLKAIDVFTSIMQERAQTGRIYIQNIDHCNTHSSFIESVAPIKQSNLCMEITLPTTPLNDVKDPDGEIALCTLAAINLGATDDTDIEDLEKTCAILVRALDNLLDYQDYPVKAAEKNKKRRTLGIGVTNFAYFLAKNNVRYGDYAAKRKTHELFEKIQYFLLKASNELAIEKGACELFNETKYSLGILPIDTYKKELDDVYPNNLKMDWDKLRENIKKNGLRNSTLSSLMPCECQSKDNLMLLRNGEKISLRDMLEKGGVPVEMAEQEQMVGQRFPIKPFLLPNNNEVIEAYYNGLQEVYEISFNGESYKFTAYHKLLAIKDGQETWVEVKDLNVGDEIIDINS